MAAITTDITEQVAAIIGDTLNDWFQPNLHFGPVIVSQLYDDWYDEDYLHAWIVWEGNHDYMDHSRIITLSRIIQPRLDDLGVDLRLHPLYIAKWDWELNKERLLK